MSIRYKVALPLVLAVLLLGGASYWLVTDRLAALNEKSVEGLVSGKTESLFLAIDGAAGSALGLAAAFSTQPEVLAAFETAHQGDIGDEADPKGQEAREMLRAALAPALRGFESVVGSKMQLHYHLPNGRSLARLWRDKQTKRDGKWLDISDDISSFRPTVMEVNRTGRPIKGIELGSGGFAIRGVAPVKGADGRQLGSVEVLAEFEPVLARASKDKGESLALYMNADRLSVTTALQDSAKHPVLDGRFVLVSGSEDGSLEKSVAALGADFLQQGVAATATRIAGDSALAAFPISDYTGGQIGVMVYAKNIAAETGLIRETGTILLLVLLALAALPVLVGSLVLGHTVIRPVRRVVAKIQDIALDRADLKERLDDSQRDELGELATWFNRLMGKIEDVMCTVEGYANMVNAVPDPVFAVDDDYNFLMANTATQKFLGRSEAELKKMRCADAFKTQMCGTENCPIHQAKKIQGAFRTGVINIGSDDKPVWIDPVGDVLRDCHGKSVGYVEVARVVNDMVFKEQELEKNLGRIQSVNDQTRDAAGRIAAASARLSRRLDEIASGASVQRDRAAETATAMEQMNATVLEVARSAGQASSQAETTRAKAVGGQEVVSQAVAAIAAVHESAVAMKENMGRLGTQAEGIGRIVGVINDIADQTNLLALNAAIEAARAGDAGRGFAVVADEVRKLAEKTMVATKEVGEAIRAIQAGAKENIGVVDTAAAAVERATELAGQSGAALREIVGLVNETTDQVRSIATAAEEQSAASEQINRAIDEVNRIAAEAADGMAESTRAVSELAELADDLNRLSS